MPYSDDILRQFAASLAENLDGRRLLDRPISGVEPEPATLSQLAAIPRITAAIAGLESRSPNLARAADGFLGEFMRALVARSARGDVQVAHWTQADHSLTLLADLMDAAVSLVEPPR